MPETLKFKKILIIKPSSLGDILHTFQAVSLIAEKCPGASIDWLVNSSLALLPKFHPNVNNVLLFPRKELANLKLMPKSFFSLKKELKKNTYDLVIDFQGLMRSALFAKLASAPVIAGFENPREKLASLFYNKKISIPDSKIHAVEKNIYLAASLLNADYKVPQTELKSFPDIKKSLLEKLSKYGIMENDIIAGVSPVTRWESKNWSPEFFAESINKIADKKKNVKFLVIGAENDKSAADEIVAKVKSANVVSFTGKTTVVELVELIKLFSLLISNDSGPVHIAAVLNIPVICMFGPTLAEKTGPFGSVHSIMSADVDCAGCLKRICPLNSYKCHSAIKPEQAAEKALDILHCSKSSI
jgi:lipopolysaccharide heptosyltransferase I